MYYSSEEKRSDLFLAGAAYIVVPIIAGFLLRFVPLERVPIAGFVVGLLLSLASTVVVPFLLVRYRKQPWSEFGFAGPKGAALTGLLVGIPVVVAGLLEGLLGNGGLTGSSPLLSAFLLGSYLQILSRLVGVLGLTLLAIYCTVLAREAFRGDPTYLRTAATKVGRVVGIAAIVATLLLLANQATQAPTAGSLIALVIRPIGVAAAVAVAIRLARASRITTRATLVTPMVIFAIGVFALRGDPTLIVVSIWNAALSAGIGLIVGLLTESERSVWGPLAFGSVLALLTYVAA